MISRNNHIAVDPNHCIELRKAMNRLPGNDREAVRKDLHLIESALDSDGRVISRDKSMRQILHGMILEVPEMESVKWVNPEDGKCLAWVMMGAPDDPDLQLSKDL
jgi:site-specific recombinase XerC